MEDYILKETGEKLLKEDNSSLLIDFVPFVFQNYLTGFKVGDGMSVTEKIR